MSTPLPLIRFPQGLFSDLCSRLLSDLSHESFAQLLAKREQAGDQIVLTVRQLLSAKRTDYLSRGEAHLQLDKDYIHACLVDLTQRLDVDTLIDVHTHPFALEDVAFSSVDDHDERGFGTFLHETFDDIHYASIVLSQSDYAARLWDTSPGHRLQPRPALLRTQTAGERWPAAGEKPGTMTAQTNEIFSHGALALGVETLRRIMDDQQVALVGIGGIGSLLAENLVQMGFQTLHLIDPDRLEPSNLNRFAGASHEDAARGRLKVEVVADHLRRINPQARIHAYPSGIEEPALESVIAGCDWILVSTDSHTSRARAQTLSLRYFVPLIAAGVNLSVEDGQITDMSGEVILARVGDQLCLHCLGRIDPQRVAAESHPETEVREKLVRRGYVTGLEVKEPAVKTLNAILAALAVETLVNQYTGRQKDTPILVFENNQQAVLYPDRESVEQRNKPCFSCAV